MKTNEIKIKRKFTGTEKKVLQDAIDILNFNCGERLAVNEFVSTEMATDVEPIATLLANALKRYE
jgi:hypothetical protein